MKKSSRKKSKVATSAWLLKSTVRESSLTLNCCRRNCLGVASNVFTRKMPLVKILICIYEFRKKPMIFSDLQQELSLQKKRLLLKKRKQRRKRKKQRKSVKVPIKNSRWVQTTKMNLTGKMVTLKLRRMKSQNTWPKLNNRGVSMIILKRVAWFSVIIFLQLRNFRHSSALK